MGSNDQSAAASQGTVFLECREVLYPNPVTFLQTKQWPGDRGLQHWISSMLAEVV